MSKYHKNFIRRIQIKKVRGGSFNRQKLKTYISAAIYFYSLNLKKRAVNLTRKNPVVASKPNFYNKLVSSDKKYSLNLLRVRKLIKFKRFKKAKPYKKIEPVFWLSTLFNFHNLNQSLTVNRNKSYKLVQQTDNKLKNLILRSLPRKNFNKLNKFTNISLISSDINYFTNYLIWLNYIRLKLNIKNNFYSKLYQLYSKPLKFKRLKKVVKLTKFLKLRGKKTYKPLLQSRDLFFYDLHRSKAVRSLKVLKFLNKRYLKLKRYNFLYFYNNRKGKKLYTFEKHTTFKSWNTMSAVLKKKRVYFLNLKLLPKPNLKKKFYRFKKTKAKFTYFRRLTVRRRFKRGLKFIGKLLKFRKLKKILKPFLKLRRHRKIKRALRRRRVKVMRKKNKKIFLKLQRRKLRSIREIKVIKRALPFKKFKTLKLSRATSLKRTKLALRKADRPPFKFKKWRSYRVQRRLLKFKKLWEGYHQLQEVKKNQKQTDFKIVKLINLKSKKQNIKYNRKNLLRFLKISKKIKDLTQIDINLISSASFNSNNCVNLLKVNDRLLFKFINLKNKQLLSKLKINKFKKRLSFKVYQSIEPPLIIKKELSNFIEIFNDNDLYSVFNDKLSLISNRLKSLKITNTYNSLLIQNPVISLLKGLTFINYYLLKIKNKIENLRLANLLNFKKSLYTLKVDSENSKKQKLLNRREFKKFIFKVTGLNPVTKTFKIKVKTKNKKALSTKLANRREKRLGFIKRHQFRYLKGKSKIFRERTDIWLQPSMVVTNFKNLLIRKGHSFSAEKIVNNLELIVKFNQRCTRFKKELNVDSLLPWFLSRFRPIFGVKPRRKGSAIIQIPMLLNSKRSASTGHREFIRLTNKRQERLLEERLLNELIGTIENRSSTHKALVENLKLTFSNRVLL